MNPSCLLNLVNYPSLKLSCFGSGTSYSYSFKCLSIASPNVLQTQKSTTLDDGGVATGLYGAGSIVFLDRHSVKCDSNKVLTQIQLRFQGILGQSGYKIRNVFSCAVPVYPVNTCVEYYTDYAERGSSTGMIYIDKHDITCKNAGELLQGFGLQTRGSDTFIRFSFTCCSLKN